MAMDRKMSFLSRFVRASFFYIFPESHPGGGRGGGGSTYPDYLLHRCDRSELLSIFICLSMYLSHLFMFGYLAELTCL